MSNDEDSAHDSDPQFLKSHPGTKRDHDLYSQCNGNSSTQNIDHGETRELNESNYFFHINVFENKSRYIKHDKKKRSRQKKISGLKKSSNRAMKFFGIIWLKNLRKQNLPYW